MKIKLVIIICLVASSLLAIEDNNQNHEHHLNVELKKLIQQDSNDDFPELYDIEPLDEEELKTNYVRRHQYHKIINTLNREQKIIKFLDKDYLYFSN